MRRRTDLDPGFRERQIAGFDAAIREDSALAAGDPRTDRKDTVRRLLAEATEPEHEP